MKDKHKKKIHTNIIQIKIQTQKGNTQKHYTNENTNLSTNYKGIRTYILYNTD